MTSEPQAGLWTMLGRAFLRRCPICGYKKVFRGWTRLVAECPRCGHVYEREEGYWVGAIIVNTAVTEAVFGILFVGALILTIPDVQWQPLLAIALLTNGLFPVFFYPYSKTIWVAVERTFRSRRDV